MPDKVYVVERDSFVPNEGSAKHKVTNVLNATELSFYHNTMLRRGESYNVRTLERHAFIRVTEKYPGGAPTLRSFFDICGMPDCGLPSDSEVHF